MDYGDLKAVERVKGQKIESVELMKEDALVFKFGIGTLKLSDEGQDCCEHRYMRTDDDLSSFVGAEIRDVCVLDAQPVKDVMDGDSECHEVQFLVVATDMGNITMSSHNEHNGYYGGFSIRATFEESPAKAEHEKGQTT